MQQYDIAAKVLMESCHEELIRYFIGIDFLTSTLIEALPQETVSLKRSDYPVLITDNKGVKRLVIIEIQTAWDRTVPLDLLDYRTRYLISHPVYEVFSCVILDIIGNKKGFACSPHWHTGKMSYYTEF